MKRDQTCRNEHTQPHAHSHQLFVIVRPHWTASEQKDVIMGWNILLTTNSAKGKKILFTPKRPDRFWGSPSLIFSGWRGLGCEFNHPPPPKPNVKNKWNYTSTTPIRLHGVDREALPLCALKWISAHGLTTGGWRVKCLSSWEKNCYFVFLKGRSTKEEKEESQMFGVQFPQVKKVIHGGFIYIRPY